MSTSESIEVKPDGMLALATPVTLPDVLDVLVVGAGPAGTAAAFRARELGLTALVVEHDDILKRIRDYDKAKSIKPDFGAGKQMRFPVGGELIESLRFTETPGAELCRRWKALYSRFSVPVQVGVELTGVERQGDVWRAQLYNHHGSTVEERQARQVVLALGGGMPRRLDIPGNVRAIRDGLHDPASFVGRPACVIGGGTSAAEAVIAISRAKAKAADPCAVYWSHRGTKMPSVSKALAPELFQATGVRGNVRYLPGSEARAIVELENGSHVLRVEADRRIMDDRPTETTELEFEASYCVACVGQEVDWGLLRDIGIHPVSAGARGRKGLPLTRLLESCQPNVYVIGDTLNAAYFECDDFHGDTSEYREVKHRGNIKASIIDGVTVIEAVAQKLQGKREVHVTLTFAHDEAADEAADEAGQAAVAAPATPATVEGDTPARAPASRPETPAAVLVQLLDDAVLEGEQFPVASSGRTTIGRAGCDIGFPDDTLLSDRHASIEGGDSGWVLRDEGSTAGVYVRIADGRSRVLPPGAVVRVGAQWLVFGDREQPGQILHYDAEGREVGRYRLERTTTVIGRDPERAFRPAEQTQVHYLRLAADDLTLSRRHAALTLEDGGVVFRDLRSTNGADLKVDRGVPLESSDQIRIGHQLLRFALRAEIEAPEAVEISGPVADPASAAPPAGPAAADGLVVTFRGTGQTCPFERGESICEIAERHGVSIGADCHSGICGSDPIRVVEGENHLNPMSDAERSTLEDICCVDPEGHRLACVSRPDGPVVVELL